MVARFLVSFPVGPDQSMTLEPPERGLHRAARKVRDVHDVEAELVALREGLKNEEACEGKAAHVRFYIVGIRTASQKGSGPPIARLTSGPVGSRANDPLTVCVSAAT